jgi:hypothetical protein
MNRFQEPRGGLQGHWNDARGAPKDREASTPSSCDVPKGTGRSFGPEFQQPARHQNAPPMSHHLLEAAVERRNRRLDLASADGFTIFLRMDR